MRTLSDSEIILLLTIMGQDEIDYRIFWHSDLTFVVNSNDVFAWALADGQTIDNAADIDAYETAIREAGEYGPELYCARKGKCRPQGAYYKEVLPEKLWPLFDACGPERPADPFGNPVQQPAYPPYPAL